MLLLFDYPHAARHYRSWPYSISLSFIFHDKIDNFPPLCRQHPAELSWSALAPAQFFEAFRLLFIVELPAILLKRKKLHKREESSSKKIGLWTKFPSILVWLLPGFFCSDQIICAKLKKFFLREKINWRLAHFQSLLCRWWRKSLSNIWALQNTYWRLRGKYEILCWFSSIHIRRESMTVYFQMKITHKLKL